MEFNENIKSEFDNRLTSYHKLGDEVTKSIKQLLNDAKIEYYDVNFRIKSFKSFEEKIERKNYQSPFEQIFDICGIRIICFYLSDIEKINEIIRSEFNIKEDLDKNRIRC